MDSAVGLSPCASCGKSAALMCSRCKSVSYCSVECQARAFKAHKVPCARAALAISLAIPASGGSSPDEDEAVTNERRNVLDAWTVRIMKRKESLSHESLSRELGVHCTYFRPSTKLIKRAIEGLIEREYLRRDDEREDVYHYLS